MAKSSGSNARDREWQQERQPRLKTPPNERQSSPKGRSQTPTKGKQQNSSLPTSTPRGARGVGDKRSQTNLRTLIGEHMDQELVVCSVDDFLSHYAPFRPSDKSVDNAFISLLNGINAEKLLIPIEEAGVGIAGAGGVRGDPEGSGATSVRDGGVGEAAVADGGSGATSGMEEPLDEGDGVERAEHLIWKGFELPPSHISATERCIFQPLIDMFRELTKVECCSEGGAPRRRLFEYEDCASKRMHSEIDGTTFQVDARIAVSPVADLVTLADTAVVAEFKPSKHYKDIEDNRLKVVSAASQIMNDDPRRMFTYAITINDNMMAFWYFSRSHSVKSRELDFTKNHRTVIRAFLSFLFATEEELGYDPTIQRVQYEGKTCYIYLMDSNGVRRYFRTIQPLFNQRVLCITGRKTRVWEAVQVEDPGRPGQVIGEPVALKDVWLDVGANTELTIQTAIFESIRKVNFDPRHDQSNFKHLPDFMQEFYGECIRNNEFDRFFMVVKCEAEGQPTKPLHDDAKRVTGLLLRERKDVKGNVLTSSTQASAGYGLPSNIGRTTRPVLKREYRQKRQVRLIYDRVAEPLHLTRDPARAAKAKTDVFNALVFLYIANYTHRDISAANILSVVEGGKVQGKLSDLEYARPFGSTSVGGDVKTGTPYYMAIEVHSGQRLHPDFYGRRRINAETGRVAMRFISGVRTPGTNLPLNVQTTKPEVRTIIYQFTHDLESLWWVSLWDLTENVEYAQSREWAKNVFTYTFSPSSFRTNIFKTSGALVSELQDHIHPSLAECIGPLDEFRMQLVDAYRDNQIYEGRPDPAVYAILYSSAMESIALIAQCMENAQDVTLCPSLSHLLPVASKRPHRSRDNSKDEAEYQPSSEGTEDAEELVVPRKKQKKAKHQRTERPERPARVPGRAAPRLQIPG